MRTIVLSACLLLVSCTGSSTPQSTQTPTLNIVVHSDHCSTRQAGVRLLQNTAEASEATGKTVKTPIDFDRETLLLVSLGARPTPGYGVTLTKPEQDDGTTFRLPVDYREPPSDAILPQMITTPCTIIAVERVPGLQTLSVPVYGGGNARVELN